MRIIARFFRVQAVPSTGINVFRDTISVTDPYDIVTIPHTLADYPDSITLSYKEVDGVTEKWVQLTSFTAWYEDGDTDNIYFSPSGSTFDELKVVLVKY